MRNYRGPAQEEVGLSDEDLGFQSQSKQEPQKPQEEVGLSDEELGFLPQVENKSDQYKISGDEQRKAIADAEKEVDDLSYGPIGDIGPSRYMEDKNAQPVLGGIGWAGEKLDKVTGAPTRTFMSNTLGGKNYSYLDAPSGYQQMVDMGADPEGWAASLGGFGLEMIQDPIAPLALGLKGINALRAANELKAAKAAAAATDVTGSARAGARAEGQLLLENDLQQGAEMGARQGAETDVQFGGGESKVDVSGNLFERREAPKIENYPDLVNLNLPAEYSNLPDLMRVNEISEMNLPTQFPFISLHRAMWQNPRSMRDVKNNMEGANPEAAEKFALYNAGMVMEASDKLDKMPSRISKDFYGSYPEAGEATVKFTTDKIKAERERLSPVIKEISRNITERGGIDWSDRANMIENMAEKGGWSDLLRVDEEAGVISTKVAPGQLKAMGITKEEFAEIQDTVAALNLENLTFDKLENIRNDLRKAKDTANPQKYNLIESMRSSLLKDMMSMADAQGPQYHKAMQEMAVLERGIDDFERTIGKVDDIYPNDMRRANTDKVVQNIFSSPVKAEQARQFLGEEKFQKLVATRLQQGLEQSRNKTNGVIEPHQFGNWLKSTENRIFIKNYVDPKLAAEMKAWADRGHYGKQYLVYANPSGTADSILSQLKSGNFMVNVANQGPYGAIKGKFFQETAGRLDQRSKNKALSKMMAEADAAAQAEASGKGFDPNFGTGPAPRSTMRQGFDYLSDNYLPAKPGLDLLRSETLRDQRDQKPNRSPQSVDDGPAITDEDIVAYAQGTPYEQEVAESDNKAATNYALSQHRDYREAQGEDWSEYNINKPGFKMPGDAPIYDPYDRSSDLPPQEAPEPIVSEDIGTKEIVNPGPDNAVLKALDRLRFGDLKEMEKDLHFKRKIAK